MDRLKFTDYISPYELENLTTVWRSNPPVLHTRTYGDGTFKTYHMGFDLTPPSTSLPFPAHILEVILVADTPSSTPICLYSRNKCVRYTLKPQRIDQHIINDTTQYWHHFLICTQYNSQDFGGRAQTLLLGFASRNLIQIKWLAAMAIPDYDLQNQYKFYPTELA